MPTGLEVRVSRKPVDQWTRQTIVKRELLIILDRFTNPWNGLIEVRLSPLSERTNFWIALTAVD
jgi:hypothetical protein